MISLWTWRDDRARARVDSGVPAAALPNEPTARKRKGPVPDGPTPYVCAGERRSERQRSGASVLYRRTPTSGQLLAQPAPPSLACISAATVDAQIRQARFDRFRSRVSLVIAAAVAPLVATGTLGDVATVHVPYTVEQDEDGVWSAHAWLGSSGGANGNGATPEEAVADLREAVEMVIDEDGVPEQLARTLDLEVA